MKTRMILVAVAMVMLSGCLMFYTGSEEGPFCVVAVREEPEGRPEAVLIRGVEGAEGPGRLTKLLKIDRSLNREDLITSNRLWLESDGARFRFTSAPRIGIAYASKRDQKRKCRFV